MIEVGLTAVAEHPSLSPTGRASTLADLAGYFPVVELDTGFYHAPDAALVTKWQAQVSATFQFIVKATSAMTVHPGSTREQVVADAAALEAGLQPLIAQHQLAAILLQFPPFYGVTPGHVKYLRWLRSRFPHLPLAVEWRNASWYAPAYRESTLALMRELALIHVVVDEPATAGGSVPLVASATNADLTIMRLHGRNVAGWQNSTGPDWRNQRTNYRYSPSELQGLGAVAKGLASKRVIVIFNNNGGGDAAANALAFIKQEGLHFPHLGPRQLGLLD